MKPERYLILNLKSYTESFGSNSADIGRIAKGASEEYGVSVIVCPPAPWLSAVAETGAETYAQHCDPCGPGAFTGFTSPEMIKATGATGILMNHSEHKLKLHEVEFLVDSCRRIGLSATVCADTVNTVAAVSALGPHIVAIEPPELIGTGISVSSARPEIITRAIDAVRKINGSVPVIAGAGITGEQDVKRSVELGASGALVASAIVRSGSRRELIYRMASELFGHG